MTLDEFKQILDEQKIKVISVSEGNRWVTKGILIPFNSDHYMQALEWKLEQDNMES